MTTPTTMEVASSIEEMAEQNVTWTGTPPKIIKLAVEFGLIHLGWTLKDYLNDAVEKMGYETVLNWGVQGCGKSNFTLQQGYWIYEDWDAVLENIAFKPSEFVRKLKAIPKGRRVPWVGWDDIGVHYPSVSWRTNIQEYEAVDSSWAAIRTKASVMSLNIPLIDRLARNLKDNVTAEVFLGRNQTVLVERWIRLPGLKRVESTFRKLQIEPTHQFNLMDVPTDVFKEYWQRRLELTEEALGKLYNVVTKQEADPSKYITALEAATQLKCSPQTIVTLIAKNVIKGEKINGVLHFTREQFTQLKEYYINIKGKAK